MASAVVPQKSATDIAQELIVLLLKYPIGSKKIQEKIDELACKQGTALPYDVGLAAAQDAFKQIFGVLLDNLPRNERCSLEDRFKQAFEQETRRLAP